MEKSAFTGLGDPDQIFAAEQIRPSLGLDGRRLRKSLLLDRGQDVRIGMKSVVERSHRVQNLGRAFLVKVRNHNVVIILAKFLNLSGAETRYVRVFLVELFDQWGTFGPFFL